MDNKLERGTMDLTGNEITDSNKELGMDIKIGMDVSIISHISEHLNYNDSYTSSLQSIIDTLEVEPS